MTVDFLDHKKYWILEIIGRIKLSNMVLYKFIEPMKPGVTDYYQYNE